MRWEEISAERTPGEASTLLGGLPPALPALLRTHHIGVRAASVGFDWPKTIDVIDKIQEEVDELREVVKAAAALDHDRAEDEMGDLLFSIANLARTLGIEPETALRKANDKFTRRFEVMERSVAASGRHEGPEPRKLEREWEQAKGTPITDSSQPRNTGTTKTQRSDGPPPKSEPQRHKANEVHKGQNHKDTKITKVTKKTGAQRRSETS